MESTRSADRTVKATETTFAILEAINESNGIRLTDLAETLEKPKSTIHRYLRTLIDLEYLVREDGEYYVSLRFLDIGWSARTRKEGYRKAKTKVKELADETNERAQFIVEEHGRAVYVHRETGDYAVQTDPGIGKRIDLHATSAGKAVISNWPDERIEAYVNHWGLPALTVNTITDREKLMAEVETIRDVGYSVNREENIEGLKAVGAAVNGPDGEVLGALSVSGPANRMKGNWFEDELPDILMGFANEMELNLKYS